MYRCSVRFDANLTRWPTWTGPSRRSADPGRAEPKVGRPDRAGGWPAAPKRRPPDRRFYCCCASRRRPKRGRRIADSIRVVHPEGAQTEAAEAQILLLLGTQKEWNSESAGRARPTEEKMRTPTPCQEHCKRILQNRLLSNFSSDRTQGITGAPKGRPPDRRF